MDFIGNILLPIIMTVTAGLISYTKKAVVSICVKAVEQLYKELNGEDKFVIAKEHIVRELADKGIKITDSEIKLLIEACVAEFKAQFPTNNK